MSAVEVSDGNLAPNRSHSGECESLRNGSVYADSHTNSVLGNLLVPRARFCGWACGRTVSQCLEDLRGCRTLESVDFRPYQCIYAITSAKNQSPPSISLRSDDTGLDTCICECVLCVFRFSYDFLCSSMNIISPDIECIHLYFTL